jgi:hypothetical protein
VLESDSELRGCAFISFHLYYHLRRAIASMGGHFVEFTAPLLAHSFVWVVDHPPAADA